MEEYSYKKLNVYNKSYNLALLIHKYLIDKNNIKYSYDLFDQILRSTKSIPTNIAEGFGRRNSKKEYVRFLWIAIGSKDETQVHLDFLKDLKILDEKSYQSFSNELQEIGKMLYSLAIKNSNEK